MATTHLTTAVVHPARNAPEAAAFERAFFGSIDAGCDLLCLGDSQETETSQGKVYCKAFQILAHRLIGNISGTGWATFGASRQPTLFVRTNTSGTPTTPAGLGNPSSYFPPSFESSGSGPLVVTNTKVVSMVLQPDLADLMYTSAAAWPYSTDNLIDPSSTDQWVADLIIISKGEATTHTTCSTTLNWQIIKSATQTPAFYGTGGSGGRTLVASGSWTDLDTNNASHRAYKLTTTPFTLDAAAKYTSFTLAAADADGVIVVAARFRNITNPRGVRCTWASAGGYTANNTNSIPNLRANCGTILRAMEFQAAASFYGVNDAYVGGGVSAATWGGTDMPALQTLIRTAIGQVPWIIVSDQWRTEDSTGERDQFDQYPGVAADLADGDPLTRAINSRRILHAYGWNASNENIRGIVPTAWAAATSYTTSSYVTSLTFGTLRYFQGKTSHTSHATNYPAPGVTTYWQDNWREVGRYLILENPAVHYTPEGGWLKAMIEVPLIFGGADAFDMTTVNRRVLAPWAQSPSLS